MDDKTQNAPAARGCRPSKRRFRWVRFALTYWCMALMGMRALPWKSYECRNDRCLWTLLGETKRGVNEVEGRNHGKEVQLRIYSVTCAE